VTYSKVFRCPYSGTTAIASRRDSTAHITDMPGHVVGRHRRGRALSNRIDNWIFDESGESVRYAQSIHRNDQLIGADLIGRGQLDILCLNSLRAIQCSEREYEEHSPVEETLYTHQIIIILTGESK